MLGLGYVSHSRVVLGKFQRCPSLLCVLEPHVALSGPQASAWLVVGLGKAAVHGPLLSSQEAGKLEEVMQELRALRAMVKEQGERICRLEEQLGRMENGDA